MLEVASSALPEAVRIRVRVVVLYFAVGFKAGSSP
jgi:hypothetical protein